MSRFKNYEKLGIPDAPILRDYAKTLLNLADAMDAGEVHVVDKPFVEHIFMGSLKRGISDGMEMPSEPVEHISCKHDLDLMGFVLAYAYCRPSGKFFVNPKNTEAIKHHLEYLGRRL